VEPCRLGWRRVGSFSLTWSSPCSRTSMTWWRRGPRLLLRSASVIECDHSEAYRVPLRHGVFSYVRNHDRITKRASCFSSILATTSALSHQTGHHLGEKFFFSLLRALFLSLDLTIITTRKPHSNRPKKDSTSTSIILEFGPPFSGALRIAWQRLDQREANGRSSSTP